MDDPNQATYAELELEKQFQQSDAFIHRYLQLVGEYGDLPDCDNIIMPLLTDEFGKEKVDQMLGDVLWEDDDSDMLPIEDPEDRDAMRGKNAFMEDDGKKQSPIEDNCGKAASLIASSLLGWCNIYGMDLTKHDRLEAIRILYLLSKTFSFLMQAFDVQADGEYVKAIVLIQRCKRFSRWARQRLKAFVVTGLTLDSPFDNIIECLEDSVEPLNKIILEYRRLDRNDLPF
jgi:hypothetical protein